MKGLKEDNLYKGDKPLEFILVPKCPLFGDSIVCGFKACQSRELSFFPHFCHAWIHSSPVPVS